MIKQIVAASAAVSVFAILPAAAQEASWLSADDSGSFDVVGKVEDRCVVEVEDLDKTMDLFNGEAGAIVATIAETCNAGSGYKISFEFDEEGNMVHSQFSDERVDYTFSYDSFTGNDLENGVTLRRDGAEFQRIHDVIIDVKGDIERTAGTYREEVEVEIKAN